VILLPKQKTKKTLTGTGAAAAAYSSSRFAVSRLNRRCVYPLLPSPLLLFFFFV
jgi:hypothetical protein